MIAAYARVSSGGQSIATQVDSIRRAARSRGDRIGRWFHEKRSAGKLQRAELGKVRELVRRGKISKLYIFRLDRLTRTGIRDTLTLLEEFRRAGCEVVTVADGFSLDGPGSELVAAVLAWVAEQYRLALRASMQAARVRVERAGGRWGRPKRHVDVARARALQRKGKSLRVIARALKVPRATLARALKPPTTRGGPKRSRRPRRRARRA